MIRDSAAKLTPAVPQQFTAYRVLTESLSRRKKARFVRGKITQRTNRGGEKLYSRKQQQTACNILGHAHSRMLLILLLLRVYPAGGACFRRSDGGAAPAALVGTPPSEQLPVTTSSAPFTQPWLGTRILRQIRACEPKSVY